VTQTIESISDLKKAAWVADESLDGPPRALVIWMHGCGCPELKRGPSLEEYLWAKAGALVILPYYGPWCWMNREAREFADEVISAAMRLYRLGADVPLIAAGGSMGGCGSLLLARYSRHTVAACLAIHPVCDTARHFERPDVTRTMLCAFRGYAEPLAEVLAEHSPLAQAGAMPDIPYCVIQGDSDTTVEKEIHSDRLVAKLRENGREVDYTVVPGYGHEALANSRQVLDKAVEFIAGVAKSGRVGVK
jgi:dipeptidyl aminopeptidase/acylaminoacyl peptidase